MFMHTYTHIRWQFDRVAVPHFELCFYSYNISACPWYITLTAMYGFSTLQRVSVIVIPETVGVSLCKLGHEADVTGSWGHEVTYACLSVQRHQAGCQRTSSSQITITVFTITRALLLCVSRLFAWLVISFFLFLISSVVINVNVKIPKAAFECMPYFLKYIRFIIIIYLTLILIQLYSVHAQPDDNKIFQSKTIIQIVL